MGECFDCRQTFLGVQTQREHRFLPKHQQFAIWADFYCQVLNKFLNEEIIFEKKL